MKSDDISSEPKFSLVFWRIYNRNIFKTGHRQQNIPASVFFWPRRTNSPKRKYGESWGFIYFLGKNAVLRTFSFSWGVYGTKGTKGNRRGNKEARTLERALSSRTLFTFSQAASLSVERASAACNDGMHFDFLMHRFWLPLCCVLFCFSSFSFFLVYRFVFAWFQLNRCSSFI